MWAVKAVYVLMNLVALGLGVWKVNGMGLLPYVPPLFMLLGRVWRYVEDLTDMLQNDAIRLACLGNATGTA